MLTITEALAEIKLIDKKVSSGGEFIKTYAVRSAAFADPLQKNGGSPNVLASQIQSVNDLLKRKLFLRESINRKNAETHVVIEGEDKTISEWLVWRREVAPLEQSTLRSIVQKVEAERAATTRQAAQVVSDEKAAVNQRDLIVHVPEKVFHDRLAKIDDILGRLDGILSMKNATVQLEV